MLSSSKLDLSIILSYLLAGSLSLAMLFSISPDRLPQQALLLGIGLVLVIYLGAQDHAVYVALAPYLYLATLILLGSTYFFGESVRGSLRWIPLGSFQLQTSELVKPFLALFFAHYFTLNPVRDLRSLFASLLYFLPPFLLVFFQPDLGTSLVLASIYLSMLFVSGLPRIFLFVGSSLLVGLALLSPYFLAPYQLARLESFIDPSRDPLGSGYNVIQSTIAVGSGGFWGKGLGHGTQSHLKFLPERHTDFMFASLAEELGFLGLLSTLVIFYVLFARLLGVAQKNPGAGRLVLSGLACYLMFQAFINIGMNLGIAPVTGVTLPLISYGGSSILGVAISLGIASSFTRNSSVASPLEIR